MKVGHRVDKILNAVRPLVTAMRRANQTRSMKGKSLEAIVDAIETATAREDLPLLEEIGQQVEHYHSWYDSRPPRQLANGKTAGRDYHGFIEWLFSLQDGFGTLPIRLPRRFLELWRDGYRRVWGLDGGPWAPKPLLRCADCRLILPHCATGQGDWDRLCPACGSERISFSDVSRPYGTRWLGARGRIPA